MLTSHPSSDVIPDTDSGSIKVTYVVGLETQALRLYGIATQLRDEP
jgi:hypothetical protein